MGRGIHGPCHNRRMSFLELVAIVVDEYDPAIRFFVDTPPGAQTGILLARADGDQQAAAVGHQVAGRVGFFLRVDDFQATYDRMRDAGVVFVTPPRNEPYGRVAVFLDVAGNRWDLLGPA